MDLTNHFLIAVPNIEDEIFSGTVIYVCQHNEKGALGLITNKPTDISLRSLFARLELPLSRNDLADSAVLMGGPVHQEHGFVLHEANDDLYQSSLTIPSQLAMTSSQDIMEDLAHGAGPKRVLIALGCASWEEGQLEQEVMEHNWLTVKADASILFETAPEHRYAKAFTLLGIDPKCLISEAGHA